MKKKLYELLSEFLAENCVEYNNVRLYMTLQMLMRDSKIEHLESLKPYDSSEASLNSSRSSLLALTVSHCIIEHIDEIMDINLKLNKKYLSPYSKLDGAEMKLNIVNHALSSINTLKEGLKSSLNKDIVI